MPATESWEMERRRYSLSGTDDHRLPPPSRGMVPSTSEDLHAWSIYRQNLNSDFTDSALGSSEKSPLPYGNFQLRESTVQSILNHPRYGPKSPLGTNMYTYLKFGLPRVFPPNEAGNSSGYNSSNEGGPSGSPRKRRFRSTSETEIRYPSVVHPPPLSSATLYRKSLSQADLLSTETLLRQVAAAQRRSLHDLRHTDYLHHVLLPTHPTRRPHQRSQRHSRVSAGVQQQSVGPSPEPFTFSMMHPQQVTSLYPHLQIRNLNVRNSKGEPVLNNLSTEVRAGEVLSVMCTSSVVGTVLLETLSGHHNYSGSIGLNGLQVGPKELRGLTCFARKGVELNGDLTVASTLSYYSRLRRPSTSIGKHSTSDQVSIVTEELGLSPVLSTRVSKLTSSELSRLHVAIQLLPDPQILLIDDVTASMDIFDSFFLVEFLRYWAAGATGGLTGRIVVMVLQPPTYEILTMVSRILILSNCDTMYDGPSRALTHYFTPVQCPAPAYKNPADYYLDLVTLDDLSAEAMLESSQRVDQLAALHRRRSSPLTDVPPYTLPAPFQTPWPLSQAFTLLLKETYYSQPVSFSRWILRLILAALTSLLVGSIFWDVPGSDPLLNRQDRLGYHFSLLTVASWPLVLLLGMKGARGQPRSAIESDIQGGYYSRPLYIIVSSVYSIVPSLLIWLAFLIPAYCMSGLYDSSSSDNFTYYLSETLLCLISLQFLCSFFSFLFPADSSLCPLLLYTLTHLVLAALTGFPLHTADSPSLVPASATPLVSSFINIISADHSVSTLRSINSQLVCRNKQIQRQDIIVHLPCPVPNGTAALVHHGLVPGAHPILTPILFLVATWSLLLISFLISPLLTPKQKR